MVLVPEPTGAMAPGSTASVGIGLATAEDAVAVPSSALTTVGTRRTVVVLRDGEPVPTEVQTGVTGPTASQVTAGLAGGDEVVLADLDADLPTGSGRLVTRPGGGPGGFGGAGPIGTQGLPGGAPPGGR